MLKLFLLIVLLGAGAALYIYCQKKQQEAYEERAKRMVRLRIELPKKETPAGQDAQVGLTYKELSASVFEQILAALHGIRDDSFKRFVKGQDPFALEIAIMNTDSLPESERSEKPGVEFFIACLPEYQDMVSREVRSIFPDADIEAESGSPFADGTAVKRATAVQRALKWYPFRTYTNMQSDAMNTLVNALSQTREHEGSLLQIMFTSAGDNWTSRAQDAIQSLNDGNGEPMAVISFFRSAFKSKDQKVVTPQDQERAKGIGEKIKKPGFYVKIRYLTVTKDATTNDNMHRVMGAAFAQYDDPLLNGLRLNPAGDDAEIAAKTMSYWGGGKELLLTSEEITSLFHLPDHRFNQSPAIRWLTFRRVGAPANVPKPEEGIQLGTNDFQGVTTPIHIKRDDRTRHFYCIGKSGSGKSTLLEYMIKQDIRNGDGVCVIDPHGDLAEAVLPYIPKERAHDVIYFNPGDLERPAGMNLLEAPPDRRDFITGQALEIFIKLFGEEIFSPRLQHYFRNACLTLMDDEEEGGTLIEIPRLFIDEKFQQAKVAKVKNPVVRSFWEKEMANTGDREKQEMIPYLTSKFGQFITDSTVRNVIGQTKSAFDFRDAMDKQKIILVNLSKGVIGERNMSLLGMILITKVQMAAMSRFNMPAKDRKDFYLYVDEFQNFATDSFGSILSEARKYRLNLIVAHQYIKQLKDEIKNAVFGNVGSMMCFKIGAEDAEYMAKEFAPVYSQDDIVNIPNYKAYIKLCIDNATSQAFSMNTVWDKQGKNEALGEKIRELSRLTYGKKKEFVDEETRRRAGGE